MTSPVKFVRAAVKRAGGRHSEAIADAPIADGAGDVVAYEVTLPRELAEDLADHYQDDPEVGSIPDALRQAARDVLAEG